MLCIPKFYIQIMYIVLLVSSLWYVTWVLFLFYFYEIHKCQYAEKKLKYITRLLYRIIHQLVTYIIYVGIYIFCTSIRWQFKVVYCLNLNPISTLKHALSTGKHEVSESQSVYCGTWRSIRNDKQAHATDYFTSSLFRIPYSFTELERANWIFGKKIVFANHCIIKHNKHESQ